MAIQIVAGQITRRELHRLAEETYGVMIKAVVDLKRGVIAFGGQMHADARAMLLADGSSAQDLWGFCLKFSGTLEEAFDFSSHINMRPENGNSSILIKSETLREQIRTLTRQRVDWDR